VTDVNDNAPVFDSGPRGYEFWVAESEPAGTPVGLVTARDPDTGENGRISFRIFDGPDARLFALEVDPARPDEVRIQTAAVFDLEAGPPSFRFDLQSSR
jgi:hypothetical protein